MQATAQKIADAFHKLEAEVAKIDAPAVKTACLKLHAEFNQALTAHAPALGIDPKPLSGGLPKSSNIVA